MDESMWIHQLDECINACQTNVERLEIDSSFVDSPDDASETSNIVPNQTILYLSFTGRFFSEKDLVYIMDKFVSLKELHISCEPSLFRSHSSFSFGSATLLRLGCYLKTLNKFSIRGLSFKKMSHFIRIVHDIAVEGDTTIDTKIAKSFEKVAHKSVSLRYSRGKTSEFSITSHIYSSDIAKEEVDLPFAYQRLTELSLIEETSVNSEMFPGILSIDTKYRIDGILKNCTRLKKLYINNVFFASPAPPIFNHSIECLVFINYNCDPLHLEQLLAQLPNVKALTLSNSFIDSGENETPKFKINLEHNQLDELTFDTLGSNGFSLKIATPTDTVNFRFAKSLQQIPKLGRPDIHIILGHVKKVNLDPNSRRPLRVVL
ncbi:hypothetical protein BD560DRAFT_62464 [Blakeslea trispora]|nr:hypothetical protein BD560DRAFT_62464 [Blakeslea trispora]